jgi:hypothetical protein
MNVFNHRSLERPVAHLLEQAPGLGVLDRKSLTLYLNDGGAKIDELVARYEEFYQQREVSVSVPEALCTAMRSSPDQEAELSR